MVGDFALGCEHSHCLNMVGESDIIDVAQKKTAKRKRDEYHVKEETQQTNTSTIVDMHNVNYRSNMTGLVKFMKTTKFTQTQLGCLRQTPFWNLLDTLRNNQIDLDKCMKYDDVVVHVLQMYKASKDAFYIGGEEDEHTQQRHQADLRCGLWQQADGHSI
ncbi:hypothetical protein ACSBR1_017546 [Camellia fascicularis]